MSEQTSAVADAMANAQAVPAAPLSVSDAAQTTDAPADQTPEDSAPSESIADASPTDAPETPSRGDKRIQQLLAERHQDRERIARLEGMLSQRQPASEQQEVKPAPLPQDLAQWLGEEPKPDAFPAGEFDPQYLRAIARYEARAEQAQATFAQRAAQARMAEQRRLESIRQSVAEAEKAMPDIREVASGLGQRLPNWQANLVAEAGPEVIYAIGKDAEAEARIRAANTPLAVAREIGRIEARLERAKDSPPPPQPSAAPPPPPKAVRGSSSPNGFDWATASPAEIQARINRK